MNVILTKSSHFRPPRSWCSDISERPVVFRFTHASVNSEVPRIETLRHRYIPCRIISSTGPTRVDPNDDDYISTALTSLDLEEGDIYVHTQRTREDDPRRDDEISRWILRSKPSGILHWVVTRAEPHDPNSLSPVDANYRIVFNVNGYPKWIPRNQADGPVKRALRDYLSWASPPREDLR